MGNHVSKTTADGRTLISLRNSQFEEVPKEFAAFLDDNIPEFVNQPIYRFTKKLIEAGVDVDAQDENGRTLLMRVIASTNTRFFWHDDRADIIEVCLNNNANIYLRDKKGKSVWQMIHWSDVSTTQLLMKKLREQYTDRKSIAEALIEANCPLHIVVLTKDAEMVKLILDHGCPVVDPVTRVSALSVAIHYHYYQDARIAQLILECRVVDVLADDYHGCAPKKWIADVYKNHEQHLNFLKSLLDHGVYEFSEKEEMAISKLLKTGDRRTISLLFQYLQDLSKKDSKGSTVLHYLACNNNEGVLEEIRDKQFDVNQIDGKGLTALHYALGKSEWVEFLLKNGADVDAGEIAALFYAFWRPEYTPAKSVELLLRLGVDPQVRHNGVTIFDVPVQWSSDKTMEPVVARLVLLESLGESIDKSIIKRIQNNSHFTQRYEMSNRQIERMKNRSVVGSISLFTLLTADDKRFAGCVRNPEVIAKFEWIIRRFPAVNMDSYYFNILRDRMDEVREVMALKEKLARVIFKISGFHYDEDHIIVDNIIRYFSVKELREFDIVATD